jgi:hypothetical protein
MRIFNSLNAHTHLAWFTGRFAATTEGRSVNGTEFVAAQFHDEFSFSRVELVEFGCGGF